MYKLAMLALTSLAAAVASTAYAGRDVGQIDQQEKANRAAAEQRSQGDARARNTARRVVLPLDHGPHAQTTPWLNKQRLLRAKAMESGATSETFPK